VILFDSIDYHSVVFNSHILTPIPAPKQHDGDVTKHWGKCASRHLAQWKPCLDKANDPVCYEALLSSTSDWDLLHCYAERFEDARKLRDSIPQEDTAGRTKVLRDHFMQVGAPEGRNPLCAHDGVYNLPQYLPKFGGHGMLAVWIDGVLLYTENHKAGSTTIRRNIKLNLGTNWESWKDDPQLAQKLLSIDDCIQGNTTTTTFCVGPDEMDRAIKFTTTRNPLEKFISGYHQLVRDPTPGFDETTTIAETIARSHENAHLRSNLFHLGLAGGEGRPVLFDKLFHLEAMDEQWPKLIESFPNLGADKKTAMIPATRENVKDGNVRKRKEVKSVTESFGGDRAAIDRFCYEFGWDYFCLGYEMPKECQDASLWSSEF